MSTEGCGLGCGLGGGTWRVGWWRENEWEGGGGGGSWVVRGACLGPGG